MGSHAQKPLLGCLLFTLALTVSFPDMPCAGQNRVENSGFEAGLSGWAWRAGGGGRGVARPQNVILP